MASFYAYDINEFDQIFSTRTKAGSHVYEPRTEREKMVDQFLQSYKEWGYSGDEEKDSHFTYYESTLRFRKKNGRHVQLFYRYMEHEAPKGVVFYVHGVKVGTHLSGPLAHSLLNAGYSIYSFDQEGHGKSQGSETCFLDDVQAIGDNSAEMFRQLIINGDELVANNLKQAAELYKNTDLEDMPPPKSHLNRRKIAQLPVFLLGCSMGGATALKMLLDHKDVRERCSGLVLYAPMVKIYDEPGYFKASIVSMLRRYLPNTIVTSGKSSSTRVPFQHRWRHNNPYCYQKGMSAQTVYTLIQFSKEIQRRLKELKSKEPHLPLLLLHGTHDKVTCIEGSKALFEAYPHPDRTFIVLNNAPHAIHRDYAAYDVFRETIYWMNERGDSLSSSSTEKIIPILRHL